MQSTNYYLAATCLVLTMFSIGCDDAIAPAPQTRGAIEIKVATTFENKIEFDPISFPRSASYTVGIDGGVRESIAYDGRALIEQLRIGRHAVMLSGLPYNCSVNGDNPVSVELTSAGLVGSVNFSVYCAALIQTPGWDY